MSEIAKMLDSEIERTLSEIAQMETGTDKAKAALFKLDKLHGERVKELEAELKTTQQVDASLAKMDEKRLKEAELDLRIRQVTEELELRKAELDQKDKELQEAKKGRRWRTLLDILGIAVPTAASGYWLYKGMKFEEEGKIYSSRTTQWFSGIARLFKKG